MREYSPYTFSAFRILLGLYLLVHFVHLVPYAPDVWGASGMLPDPSLNPTYGLVPNPLDVLDGPVALRALLVVLAGLALAFAAGLFRRAAAVLLWLGWVFLFNRNNLIANPSIPFVGWLLLASALVPAGEPLSLRRPADPGPWRMPPILFRGAWLLMGLGYTLSGLDKLGSPSWVDGTAMTRLLENPLARDGFLREALLAGPPGLRAAMTWGVLGLELAFGPLCLLAATRKWAWLAMAAMHLGILSVVAFADLTAGMLLIHAFTFDPRWLPARKAAPPGTEGPIVFFDGVCGLCNRFVDFVITEDRAGAYRFAPLQGATAAARLGAPREGDPATVVLADGPALYRRSEAALRIIGGLGGVFRLALLGLLVPAALRDRAYDFVAARRYRWFGRKESCRMPAPEERGRFLP